MSPYAMNLFFSVVCPWIELKFNRDFQDELLFFLQPSFPLSSSFDSPYSSSYTSGFSNILTMGRLCIGRRKRKYKK
jgi:hypothetical protein